MIPVPSNVRVWLAVGKTDMRRGMIGLALQVQESLHRDPHAGDLYVFRGHRAARLALLHPASEAAMGLHREVFEENRAFIVPFRPTCSSEISPSARAVCDQTESSGRKSGQPERRLSIEKTEFFQHTKNLERFCMNANRSSVTMVTPANFKCLYSVATSA